MPRDLELLSEKELFDKTKKIAEYVRNAEIELRYLKGENYVEYRGTGRGKSKFRITLATPTRKNITKYVALLHELGHVIYETPFTQMITLSSGSTRLAKAASIAAEPGADSGSVKRFSVLKVLLSSVLISSISTTNSGSKCPIVGRPIADNTRG